ncbi:MAG: hypothetical protein H0T80_10960 [Betaproteobacteria bacterium]|nr:hypothetical protein [Betaproteobacteria bacterium]
MSADVAQRERSQHRVQQHIGIGMPGKAAIERNRLAPDDERPTCHEPVHIDPLPMRIMRPGWLSL